MACRNAYKSRKKMEDVILTLSSVTEPVVAQNVDRLLFGVDSKIPATTLLQNNIEEFEWVVRNKIYPNFWGRNLVGENALTKQEIDFLHRKGCKIAVIYTDSGEKQDEKQGGILAEKAVLYARDLGIPEGTAIFLEIGENENVTHSFMLGFAKALIVEGFTPAFKANTDAKFDFDREYSVGMQTNREVFKKCFIWAVAPTVEVYNGMTTSHLIHPDDWQPYAPSCITRKEIAVWQYGVNCHPIEDDLGKVSVFNLDLVRNEQVIIEKMF